MHIIKGKGPKRNTAGPKKPVRAPRARKLLADELGELLQRHAGDGILVADLLDLVGERGFGLLLILASLPLLIPMPPGASLITGLITIFVSVQNIMGRRTVWLPNKVLNVRIGPKAIHFLITKALPVLKRIEGIGGKRLSQPAGPTVMRLAAAVAAAIGVVLIAPIPFFNTVPALVGLAIGTGLTKNNSLILWVGIALGSVIIASVVVGLSLLIPGI